MVFHILSGYIVRTVKRYDKCVGHSRQALHPSISHGWIFDEKGLATMGLETKLGLDIIGCFKRSNAYNTRRYGSCSFRNSIIDLDERVTYPDIEDPEPTNQQPGFVR